MRELATEEVERLKDCPVQDLPYIKSRYQNTDDCGSLAGFILRRKVPHDIEIAPVNPTYSGNRGTTGEEIMEELLRNKYVKIRDEDGTVRFEPNPDLSSQEREMVSKENRLRIQAAEEDAARFPKGQENTGHGPANAGE